MSGGVGHHGVDDVALAIGAGVPGGVADVVDDTAHGNDIRPARQRPVHESVLFFVIAAVGAVVVIVLAVFLPILAALLPHGVTPLVAFLTAFLPLFLASTQV